MPTLIRHITLAALALVVGTAAAHEGGVNADGCHHDGQEYHCHRGESSAPRHIAPSHSGSSLDKVVGDSMQRSCTPASLACGAGEKPAQEGPGITEMPDVGGAGLALAVLLVLGMYAMRRTQQRSRHRN